MTIPLKKKKSPGPYLAVLGLGCRQRSGAGTQPGSWPLHSLHGCHLSCILGNCPVLFSSCESSYIFLILTTDKEFSFTKAVMIVLTIETEQVCPIDMNACFHPLHSLPPLYTYHCTFSQFAYSQTS